ncbi:hypothetical protein H696_01009 [Fonticula alba]|uniref:Uncharacterized protein n=1 Tax=Fonticula alba TaxID=691883 RepID=A0A058ZGH5_FONAL|nr:hypothetical protein H696_01009 [Fonticula alba]KCV73470.1 hypothetical protein H696_01009 [Fonticula alba]|eukprot:XP_009493171.1 hypothetical protein H696_01009 [Fonticula alba]
MPPEGVVRALHRPKCGPSLAPRRGFPARSVRLGFYLSRRSGGLAGLEAHRSPAMRTASRPLPSWPRHQRRRDLDHSPFLRAWGPYVRTSHPPSKPRAKTSNSRRLSVKLTPCKPPPPRVQERRSR